MATYKTTSQIAAALGISRDEFQDLEKQPEFPVKVNGEYSLDAIKTWLAGLAAASLDDQFIEQVTTESDTLDLSCDAPPEPPLIRYITLQIPLCAAVPKHIERNSLGRVDVKFREQRYTAFCQLHAGLDRTNARMQDERPVSIPADVFRWVLDQIIEALNQDQTHDSRPSP
jgi:hypothetical protein